jgi:hypothetical protein
MAPKKNEKNSKLSKSATRNNIIDEIVEEDDDSGNVNARTSVSLKKNNNGKRKSNAPNSYDSSSSSFSIPNNQGFNPSQKNFEFEIKINELMKNCNKNEFKKSEFKINNELKLMSPIYEWFKCKRVFQNEVAFKSPVKFRCIICKDDELKDKEGLTATIGQNANLVHHRLTYFN